MSVTERVWKTPKTNKTRYAWMIDLTFTHSDGSQERIREILDVRSEQAAWVRHAEVIEELKSGTYWANKEATGRQSFKLHVNPTLEDFVPEFIRDYCEPNLRPATKANYQRILEGVVVPLLGKKKLRAIGSRDINMLKAKLYVGCNGNKKSHKSVKNLLGPFSKLLNYAVDCEILSSSPKFKFPRINKAEKIKRENFLEFDEATALVEAAGYNPEWQGMILFALRTGVRYGELCELRWSDIDFDRQVVTISRSFHRGNVGPCKSGVDRVVDLSPETLQMLRSLKHLKGPLVFCKEDGGRHIHRRADVALKRCAARAGIERSIGWHTLRHTFASHLAMKNIPMRSIQELLGHASLDMTLRYAHLARGVNREAVAQLDESHRETGHKFRASGGPEA